MIGAGLWRCGFKDASVRGTCRGVANPWADSAYHPPMPFGPPMPTSSRQQPGCWHLFRAWGIDVHLHWSWLLIAGFFIASPIGTQSMLWRAAAYLTLFAIITLHEFGHALATRSVGGSANTIVLWPLGGIAFVTPPRRPGAVLWSIAAGPLVNLALIPATLFLAIGANSGDPFADPTSFAANWAWYTYTVFAINLALFCFNMLPIYPLDGGQIVQALLWFVIGQAKSLKITATLGLIAGAAVFVGSLLTGELWFVILAVFVMMQAWRGLQIAKVLTQQEAAAAQRDQAIRDMFGIRR